MIQVRTDAGNEIGTLVSTALAVEKVIRPQTDREVWPRFDLQDRGELPIACKPPQRVAGKLRHLRDCGKIEDVPLIRALRSGVIARSTIGAAAAGSDGRYSV